MRGRRGQGVGRIAVRTPGLVERPPFARVAVSECLRGSPVRWNGEHSGDGWPRQATAALFELVGICPEVGIGMGVPRRPIQLVGDAASPRAVAVAAPSRDYTAQLRHYAQRQAARIDSVCGYIFAERSPSCGLAGVKVFDADGTWRRIGRGVFAAAVVAARPALPVADAQALADEGTLLTFAAAVIRRAVPDAAEADIRASIDAALNDL